MDVALSADTCLAEDLVNEHSYNFDDNQDQPNQNDDEEASDDGWVPMDIESPKEYDLAIESNIERLQQEAVRINWKDLVKDLNLVYMAQKVKTKNWAHKNAYTDHTSCNCISGTKELLILLIYTVGLFLYHLQVMDGLSSRFTNPACQSIFATSAYPPQLHVAQLSHWGHAVYNCTEAISGTDIAAVDSEKCKACLRLAHHSKASRDYKQIHTSSLFISQSKVDAMTARIRDIELHKKPQDKKDQCKEAHKAADDKRNESSWKGCSLDKFMTLRGLLDDKRSQLQFGTLVFHAYVHSWTCQLDYNPQLNKRWGLSDGEGLERMWSYLSSLYHNNQGIKQLSIWLKKKFIVAVCCWVETKAVLLELLDKLNLFSTTGANYTKRFFKAQWQEQHQFKETHTKEQEDHQAKFLALYKQEAALEALRSCLRSNPSLYLNDKQEVHELLDELEETAENLKKATKELGRTKQPAPGEADGAVKIGDGVELAEDHINNMDFSNFDRVDQTNIMAVRSLPTGDTLFIVQNRKEPEVVIDNVEEDAILGVHVDDGEELQVQEDEQAAGNAANTWEDVEDAQY
ncbi:hypothetical protein PGTUg99_021086 [Puccinia graminis f. sp. tritici]|uniref:CxC1-like cysteine cluster associated with KDZ transposases domain-containing protein n=1 Tax=Puccinia graminis f. sp. tritici TaxID=56615 RepID=A0A5B0SCK0_PUCGR|nr:hypothetical protein PGTUg99_021086 [Puccinia graminis f. sp. tritici]